MFQVLANRAKNYHTLQLLNSWERKQHSQQWVAMKRSLSWWGGAEAEGGSLDFGSSGIKLVTAHPFHGQKMNKVWCPTRPSTGKGWKKKDFAMTDSVHERKLCKSFEIKSLEKDACTALLTKGEVEKLQFSLINSGSCCCGWGRGTRVYLSWSVSSTT